MSPQLLPLHVAEDVLTDLHLLGIPQSLVLITLVYRMCCQEYVQSLAHLLDYQSLGASWDAMPDGCLLITRQVLIKLALEDLHLGVGGVSRSFW